LVSFRLISARRRIFVGVFVEKQRVVSKQVRRFPE
jgi:hypothetical protein